MEIDLEVTQLEHLSVQLVLWDEGLEELLENPGVQLESLCFLAQPQTKKTYSESRGSQGITFRWRKTLRCSSLPQSPRHCSRLA